MAELPIADFLRERLKEYDPTFEVRKGTGFDKLVFKPMQFMVQPLRDEADTLFIGQSMQRILQTENPDSFDEGLVDELVANVFVYRNTGNTSSGVARVYYSKPVNREWPTGGLTITGSNSKNYVNLVAFSVTEDQMSAQIEQGTYYFDVPVSSTDIGTDNNLEADNLVSVAGDPDAISVTNKNPILGGVDRETNTQLLARAKRSIAVRDLVTGKGFSAILFDNFPGNIREVQAIGFGDVEMMRDIQFNCHIGGKHDGYIKTGYITTKSKDFIGILIDATRAAWTTTQVALPGLSSTDTSWVYLGESSIDRTKSAPVVTQVKNSIPAIYKSEENLSNPINLVGHEYVKITIDSTVKIIKVAGSIPSTTRRSEILIAINYAFGINVAFVYKTGIEIISPTSGKNSFIKLESPGGLYGDGLSLVFGLTGEHTETGDGPITFQEDIHYTIDNDAGNIRRIIGDVVVNASATNTGAINGTTSYPTSIITSDVLNIFHPVAENDIISILDADTGSGNITGDYRILSIDTTTPSAPKLIVDGSFIKVIDITNKYYIKRTGIKAGELVYVEYYFNPLSIDVGKYIKLDAFGKTRGIRAGRADFTISDVPFLKINSVEVIDPVSSETTGEVLNGLGGYGLGGYGNGPYGIGSSANYRLVTNSPEERFSCFEDSYIIFDSAYQGYSFRITYDCVPELEDIHNFCRSDNERVLDGDVLIKHFIPTYVDTTIEYSADDTDASIPDNDTLTGLVKTFITNQKIGLPLDISDITQFILKNIDPYFRYTGKVKPFTVLATIHNTDGTTTMVQSDSVLEIPTPNPFPKYTSAPISNRVCHWIAGNITMTRS